jgi:hypothetical protein
MAKSKQFSSRESKPMVPSEARKKLKPSLGESPWRKPRGKHKHISHKHMSLSSLRRRENPAREEIYKEHLKHRQASSNGASSHASNGTIIELDGQTPDDQPAQCTPNRRKKHPLGRVILPPPILGGGLGLWYWVYLSRLELTVDEQE